MQCLLKQVGNKTALFTILITGGMRQSVCAISSEKEEPTNLNTRRSILKTSNNLDVNPPNYQDVQKESVSGEIQLNILQH